MPGAGRNDKLGRAAAFADSRDMALGMPLIRLISYPAQLEHDGCRSMPEPDLIGVGPVPGASISLGEQEADERGQRAHVSRTVLPLHGLGRARRLLPHALRPRSSCTSRLQGAAQA